MTEDGFFMLCLFIAIIALLIGWFSTTGFKSQNIRLIDVFLWSPIVIYCAFVRNIWTTLILVFIGASTMSYNLKNYLVQGGYIL